MVTWSVLSHLSPLMFRGNLVNNYGNLFLLVSLEFRLKVKEDVIAELHGNVLKKDEEIASLKSLLDEQKTKNNVSKGFATVSCCVFQKSENLRQGMNSPC